MSGFLEKCLVYGSSINKESLGKSSFCTHHLNCHADWKSLKIPKKPLHISDTLCFTNLGVRHTYISNISVKESPNFTLFNLLGVTKRSMYILINSNIKKGVYYCTRLGNLQLSWQLRALNTYKLYRC